MKIPTLKEVYILSEEENEINYDDPKDVFAVWDEFLGGYEDFTKEEANNLVAAVRNFGGEIDIEQLNTEKKLALVEYKGKKYIIELDDDDETVNVSSPEDWLQSVMWDERAFEYVRESNFNEDFWESPSPLYHATPEENVEEILEDGLEARSETRGLSNRGMGEAVFASTEPEGYIESYGDAVIEIDMPQMKADGYTPEVGQEEDIERYEQESSLINLLGLDNEMYPEQPEGGMDYNTIAIFGDIPPKYLKVLEQ